MRTHTFSVHDFITSGSTLIKNWESNVLNLRYKMVKKKLKSWSEEVNQIKNNKTVQPEKSRKNKNTALLLKVTGCCYKKNCVIGIVIGIDFVKKSVLNNRNYKTI